MATIFANEVMQRISRVWAMPTPDTFDCPPIGEFVKRYLAQSQESIDPFARNKRWAKYTNDLNPETQAEYHMKADKFLSMLIEQKVKADLIIFDPPYSLSQAQEVYAKFGEQQFSQADAQNVGAWQSEKKLCNKLLQPGGVFLHFGWHSNGLGKKYHCRIIEILLVAHGHSHNDTICLAELKEAHQGEFSFATPSNTSLNPTAESAAG